ncbi:MAG: hypothetical protein ACOX1Z_02990 [Candidatus Ratteibacteria bacterium]|jgi:hypothetical protein
MCKCCGGSKKEEKKIYKCRKCGRISEGKSEECCGEIMKEKV